MFVESSGQISTNSWTLLPSLEDACGCFVLGTLPASLCWRVMALLRAIENFRCFQQRVKIRRPFSEPESKNKKSSFRGPPLLNLGKSLVIPYTLCPFKFGGFFNVTH